MDSPDAERNAARETETSSLSAAERCPGCGSIVSDRFQSCRPIAVDVTRPGYRYLAGTWGYCLHLGRHVETAETPWLSAHLADLDAARAEVRVEDGTVEADQAAASLAVVLGQHDGWAQTGPHGLDRFDLVCHGCGAVLLVGIPDGFGEDRMDELQRDHVAASVVAAGFGPTREVEAERDRLRTSLEALPAEYEQRVHESFCGSPLTCDDTRGCAGRLAAPQVRLLRRTVRDCLVDEAKEG